MSTLDIIENKISYIIKHLALAEGYKNYDLEKLRNDTTLQSALERELYIIAQAVVDLAEATVSFKNLRKPSTMRDAFYILGETDILPKDFIEKFINIVGFRNALAHDYEDLKIEVIYDVLQNKLPQVQEFIDYIKKSVEI